jgi:hypothetical protein
LKSAITIALGAATSVAIFGSPSREKIDAAF